MKEVGYRSQMMPDDNRPHLELAFTSDNYIKSLATGDLGYYFPDDDMKKYY